MSTGTDPNVITEGPVVEIVPALHTGQGVCRDLILAVASLCKPALTIILKLTNPLLLGQGRGLGRKPGIGLQGQLIVGDMLGHQLHGPLHILPGHLPILPGQTEHEVQIDVVETGFTCHLHRRHRLIRPVDASQSLKRLRIETLNTNGEPVDPSRPITGKPAGFEGPGIRFQCHLRSRNRG